MYVKAKFDTRCCNRKVSTEGTQSLAASELATLTKSRQSATYIFKVDHFQACISRPLLSEIPPGRITDNDEPVTIKLETLTSPLLIVCTLFPVLPFACSNIRSSIIIVCPVLCLLFARLWSLFVLSVCRSINGAVIKPNML